MSTTDTCHGRPPPGRNVPAGGHGLRRDRALRGPSLLVVSLGRGSDEIALRLFENEDGTTRLELRHATTREQHEIGGQMYDAIFCMGGGYYPRLWALGQHLRGTLCDEYDPRAFHRSPEMQPVIQRGCAAMQALLEADAEA